MRAQAESICSGALDDELPLAVIAQATSLEDTRNPELADRLFELFFVIDRGVRGDRNFQAGEQSFFVQPILGHLQRGARRPNRRQLLQRRERFARNVFPIECNHVASRRQLDEGGLILQRADQDGRHLRRPARRRCGQETNSAIPRDSRRAPSCAPIGPHRRFRRVEISRLARIRLIEHGRRLRCAKSIQGGAHFGDFIGEDGGGE